MLKHELKVYQLVLRDPHAKPAKWLLGLAVGYALLPLISSLYPGHRSSRRRLIVPLLVLIALKLVPAEVVADCRVRSMGGASESEVPGLNNRR